MKVFYADDRKLLLVRFDTDSGQLVYMNSALEDWADATPAVERTFFRGDGELSEIGEQDAMQIFDALKAKK